MSATQIMFRVPRKGISEGKRKVEVEVDGVKGESCTDLTAPFIQALGVSEDQTLKADFYEQAENIEFLNDNNPG